MKRLLFTLLMAMLFVIPSMAQLQQFVKVAGASALANDDTVNFKIYLDDFGGVAGLDSIWYYIVPTGEIDIDKAVLQKGFGKNYAAPTAYFADEDITLTTNNADGVATLERMGAVVGTNSTITGNVVNVFVIMAAAGCDATDPNSIEVWCLFWY